MSVAASMARTGIEIRSLTSRANGIRQYYLEAGNGPPVVLLHGFPETGIYGALMASHHEREAVSRLHQKA